MIKFDFTKTPITQIADYIIISAAKLNASDIHFDPREDGMMVRHRVDGELQNYTYIPKAYERNLTTRLKLLANMNITESRLPQDGAIKGNFGGTYLDMRVSCLPLNEGEKIVIRILDYTRSLQGLDHLGFNDTNIVKLKRMIQVPNGIILITGATGSGKSTTVYSILQVLNREETNIITVEDPIEMNIEGLNQVQVNSEIGMTFAAALRSILRQDPNIILIGEIRDSETAQIAVRASITGHLVLSTIHTNNTLSTVERLLDMNVERYLLSSALTGIISQRLAKRICTHCKIERETTKFEKKVFKIYMNKEVDKIWDANPEGCEACRKGYRGRIAIQEVLELDDEIRNALNNERLTKEDIAKLVYSEKVITMLQDALGKVLDGITSFEEVYRVIEIEDSDAFFESTEQEEAEKKEPNQTLTETNKNKTGPDNKQELEIVNLPSNKQQAEEKPELIITIPDDSKNIEPTPSPHLRVTPANKTINSLEKLETTKNTTPTPQVSVANPTPIQYQAPQQPVKQVQPGIGTSPVSMPKTAPLTPISTPTVAEKKTQPIETLTNTQPTTVTPSLATKQQAMPKNVVQPIKPINQKETR